MEVVLIHLTNYQIVGDNMPLWGSLQGKKTYIVTAMGILGAVVAYLTGDMTPAQAWQTIMPLLATAALKHGQAN